jgi:predicted TIM-barrel fold metal-dependent hydrolase
MPEYMGDLTRPQSAARRATTAAKFQQYDDMGWTPQAQLHAMEVEGIDVALLFPTRGLFALAIDNMDPQLAAAVARAYNNWLYDFCQSDPKRLFGAAMVSPFDIEDTISEAKRCVEELGFRVVFLRQNQYNGRNWHDPYYDPLWSTLEELDVPIGFHMGSPGALPNVGDRFGANTMLSHALNHYIEQMCAAASFCAAGVLVRHPKLRAAFLEADCGWVPHFLWRLDEHWEQQGDVYVPEQTVAPSELFKNQCYASVEPDEVVVKYVIDSIGNDGLVVSTDFPHGNGKFPVAVESFLELPITEEDKRKILWDNTAHLYGIKG